MNKKVNVVVKVISGVLITICVVIGYAVYSYTHPTNVDKFTSGSVGKLNIGDTKEQILVKLENEYFSPQPKPEECPKNWLKYSE